MENREYQYCIRCGRKLKSKEAKERGMGRVCFERYCEAWKNKELPKAEFKKSRLFEVKYATCNPYVQEQE